MDRSPAGSRNDFTRHAPVWDEGLHDPGAEAPIC
jgi:hypothetical protein